MSSPVVLVTGASRGLGKAMAVRFRDEGCRVVGISRSGAPEELAGWLQADLTDAAERDGLPDRFGKLFDRLDVLVNNAGMGVYETWQATSEADLRRVFELNFFAVCRLTQLFLPWLEARGGTVINTASVAGKMPIAGMGPYCATKYAVTAFSDSLRAELAPRGVNVLNLVVGRIPTGFSEASLGGLTPPETPELVSPTPGKLAERVFRAWRRRQAQLTYPRWYALLPTLARLFPRWFEAEARRRWGLE